MKHYDSSYDRRFNCAVLYLNNSNRRMQANIKTIAPAADMAMELATKIVRAERDQLLRTVAGYEAEADQ